MCRWAAWHGAPMFLDEVISRPEHSLIAQSQRAEECKTAINADGFGAAWYNHRPEPGVFRDVHPAWSDANLASLAHQVQAPLFLVHVRASTGSAISRENCHPFVNGRWSFMHNGQVGGFPRFQKQADMLIPEALYPSRRGSTDSEVIFLHALGLGLDGDPLGAMAQAVADLQALSRRAGTGPHMRFSAAFSDGARLYAVRYASDARAPSLYWRHVPEPGGFLVVSEPIDSATDGWTEVPAGAALVVSETGAEARPFCPPVRAAA